VWLLDGGVDDGRLASGDCGELAARRLSAGGLRHSSEDESSSLQKSGGGGSVSGSGAAAVVPVSRAVAATGRALEGSGRHFVQPARRPVSSRELQKEVWAANDALGWSAPPTPAAA